jgi:hypothetical protein
MLKLSMLFTDCSNKDRSTDNITIESLTDTVSIDDNDPNDNLTYVCYIDAKDGGNFRYFTTPENMELIQ